jgi:transcription regulator MmyB-like protein/helix-turn-helix protein
MNLPELGAFLKSRRDRIRPPDVGLPVGPRRRVPGLRRDEVAMLAGASTDYLIDLERGSAQPSEQMLAALSRALRLSIDERDHIYRLAGRSLPPAGGPGSHIEPALLDLLDRLTGTPAQITTDLQVALVRNRLAQALLGAVATTRTTEDSFHHQWFTDPEVRLRYHHADHAIYSRNLVADLRAATARRNRRDAESTRLITVLCQRSEEFSALWNEHDVAVKRHDTKRIQHPDVGVIEVSYLSLFSEDGRQRLTWFTPVPGSHAVEQLELLAVVGTQNLAP